MALLRPSLTFQELQKNAPPLAPSQATRDRGLGRVQFSPRLLEPLASESQVAALALELSRGLEGPLGPQCQSFGGYSLLLADLGADRC